MNIRKPTSNDISTIQKILAQWTDSEEVEKYINRIEDEMDGIVKYNTKFWIIEHEDGVVGVGGISNPLPKVIQFSIGENPIEIKILYIDNQIRGKGVGRELLIYIEELLKKSQYDEIIIRSAEKYKDTAYGFYEKMGYELIGYIDNNMAVFRKQI